VGRKGRFAGSLEEVSESLHVPYHWVIQCRDVENCPVLRERPFDLQAFQLWLLARANITADVTSESDRGKLKVEAEELQQTHRIFSRDKAFWIAVIALGITVSKEVRDWIQGDAAGAGNRLDHGVLYSVVLGESFVAYLVAAASTYPDLKASLRRLPAAAESKLSRDPEMGRGWADHSMYITLRESNTIYHIYYVVDHYTRTCTLTKLTVFH
jgi:hypothetical protein